MSETREPFGDLLGRIKTAITEQSAFALEQLIPEIDATLHILELLSGGVTEISKERCRQVQEEGFTREHDASHSEDESMGWVAACYAAPGVILIHHERSDSNHTFHDPWPPSWDRKWDKRGKHDRIKQLAIAGALCGAEIDRLQASVLTSSPAVPPRLCSHLLPGPHAEREGKWLLTKAGETRSTVICNYCQVNSGIVEGDTVVPIQHWLFGFPVVLSTQSKRISNLGE